jgi:hypothetical protein
MVVALQTYGCGRAMRVIAVITAPALIDRLLNHVRGKAEEHGEDPFDAALLRRRRGGSKGGAGVSVRWPVSPYRLLVNEPFPAEIIEHNLGENRVAFLIEMPLGGLDEEFGVTPVRQPLVKLYRQVEYANSLGL